MTDTPRSPQGAAAQGGAPPSGLTPPRPFYVCNKCGYSGIADVHAGCNYLAFIAPPSAAAIAEYSAEEIRRLASIREALIEAAKTRSNYGHPWCNVCNRRWEEHSSACVVTRGLADLAWLLARLDAPRESTARAAPDGPSPVAGAPEGGLTPPRGSWFSAGDWIFNGQPISADEMNAVVQRALEGGLTPDVERGRGTAAP